MRHLRSVLPASLFALAIAGSGSGCGSEESRPEATEVSAADAKKLLSSTPWLDHMPAGEKDAIHLLQLDPRGKGVYVNGNVFRGTYELFDYVATSSELRVTFLDSGDKAKGSYRIERMKRKGFDLRLTLSPSPRGPSVFYGFEQGQAMPDAVKSIATTAAQRTQQATQQDAR